MTFHHAASILVLCATVTVGSAQALPAGSHQRSGYGGADNGSVGTTDDAGHSTVKASNSKYRKAGHPHSRAAIGSAPKGFQSTDNPVLNNNTKTSPVYAPNQPQTSTPVKHQK